MINKWFLIVISFCLGCLHRGSKPNVIDVVKKIPLEDLSGGFLIGKFFDGRSSKVVLRNKYKYQLKGPFVIQEQKVDRMFFEVYGRILQRVSIVSSADGIQVEQLEKWIDRVCFTFGTELSSFSFRSPIGVPEEGNFTYTGEASCQGKTEEASLSLSYTRQSAESFIFGEVLIEIRNEKNRPQTL